MKTLKRIVRAWDKDNQIKGFPDDAQIVSVKMMGGMLQAMKGEIDAVEK